MNPCWVGIHRKNFICGIKSSTVVCFDRNNFNFKENENGLVIYNQEKANKDRKAKPWSHYEPPTLSLNFWKQYECNEHKWIWDLRVCKNWYFSPGTSCFLPSLLLEQNNSVSSVLWASADRCSRDITAQPFSSLGSKPLHPETVLEMFPTKVSFRTAKILLCSCRFFTFLRRHTVDLSRPLCPFFPVYLHKGQTGVFSQPQYKGPCQSVNLDQAQCFFYNPQTEPLGTLFLFSLWIAPPAEFALRGHCKG